MRCPIGIACDAGLVDVTAALDAPCSAGRLFGLVDQLDAYPSWMDLVHRVEPAPSVSADAGRPAWKVELRARVGPLARSKRLRMVRTRRDPDEGVVVFERAEVDGRSHSTWVLRATVSEQQGGSRLEMHLHYGGALWTGGLLERVLADQISAGRARLLARVAEPSPESPTG